MMKSDNPAERLHDILTKIYSHPLMNKGTRNAFTVKEALANSFELEEDKENPDETLIEIFNNLVLLYRLIDEIEQRLRSIDNLDEELYIKPLQGLRRALSITNINGEWEYQRRHLDGGDIRALAFCSHELSKINIEKMR